MAGRHRSGQCAKRLAQRKAGGHRKPQDGREPYRWLGAGAVTIGMGLAMANGVAIANAEDGASGEGSSAGSASGSTGGSSDAGNGAGQSPATDDAADIDGDDKREPATPSGAGGDGSSGDTDLDVEDELGDEGELDDEVIEQPMLVERGTQPSTGLGLQSTGSAAAQGYRTEHDADDVQIQSLTRSRTTSPTTNTLDEEERTATTDTVSGVVPKASTITTASHVEATVSVVAVNPAPLEFRPIRTAVSWVLTLMGYNPNNPGVSPNPFLEAAWALYRRTESFFFNQAPTVGTAQLLSTDVADDGSVVVTGTLNVSDFNGDTVRYTATNGQSGTVDVQANGTFTYTAAPGFTGTDTFTLVASDRGGFHLLSFLQPGGAHTSTATVRITVTPAGENQTPVVGEPGYTVTAINRRSGAVSGMVQVADPDGDTLTYSLAGTIDPEVGTVIVDSATGAWKFTPTAQARLSAWSDPCVAPISFTIVATDGAATATVAVTAAIDPAARYTLETLYGGEQESWGNQGLAIGADGRIYLTTYQLDDTAGEVVVLNADGTYATTIALPSDESHPYLTAYDITVGADGRVYVSGERAQTATDIADETGAGFVAVIDPADYSIVKLADTADPASAITTDADGRILVANWNTDTITVLNADGTVASLIESVELFDDDSGVAGLAVGPDGALYLTKPSLGVVKVIDADGATVRIDEIGGNPWAITVAANGLAYVTDFETSAVTVLNNSGDVVRTLTLPDGARPSDIVVGEDGRVNVAYLGAEGGAIATFAALPIGALEATVIGDVLTGNPGSQDEPIGPVVGAEVVYQTTVGVDPATGLPRTTVAVIGKYGVTTLVHAQGEPVGAPVLGPDGVAYQTVSYYDENADIDRSGVLAVKSDGTSIFTGLSDGAPVGNVVFSGDRAYQVVYSTGNEPNSYITKVLEITADGLNTYTVDGYPGSFVLRQLGGPVVAPDGTVYLTTTSLDEEKSITTVALWGASGFASHNVAGFASGPVSIAPDGTVYQIVGSIETDSENSEFTAVTVLAVVTETGISVLPDTVAGLPLDSPVIAGGTGHHLVYDAGSGDAAGTSTLVSLTKTGLSVVAGGIPGTPVTSGGAPIRPVAGPDGSTYFTLVASPGTFTDFDGPVTIVVAVTGGGEVRGIISEGEPIGVVALGAGGELFQTTYVSATNTTAVTVITASGDTRHEFAGYPGDPGAVSVQVVTGSDDTAYQLVTHRDAGTGEYTTTVAVITADGVVAETPFFGKPSGPLVTVADGRAYLTVSSFNSSVQIALTTVFALDGTGQAQVVKSLRGNAAGALSVDSNGVARLTVLVDEGYGEVTAVHELDLAEIEFGSVARVQSIGALSALGGNQYLIDDVYLRPFAVADPSWRFPYTSVIFEMRGQVTDHNPLSASALSSWLADSATYLAEVGSAGFTRDSQGRLTYRNTYAEDVLVVYGPNPNSAAKGAYLVRPGQTVTLPGGQDGVFAASQLSGQRDWNSVVYRGAAETPVSTPKPKTQPATPKAVDYPEKMRAYDLLDGLPGSDQVAIEIIKRNGENRMVVYIGGVIPSSGMSWLESVQIRNFGHVPDDVTTFINRYADQHKPKEIMLVGYSKGGLIVQNYATTGKHKGKVEVVVTFGTGIIKESSGEYQAIHIRDSSDHLAGGLHFFAQYLSNSIADRIYSTPSTNISDKHSAANYRKAAENFEWDSKWQGVKFAMRLFEGDLSHKGVLYYRI